MHRLQLVSSCCLCETAVYCHWLSYSCLFINHCLNRFSNQKNPHKIGTREPLKPIKGGRAVPFWVIFEFYVTLVIKFYLCAYKYPLWNFVDIGPRVPHLPPTPGLKNPLIEDMCSDMYRTTKNIPIKWGPGNPSNPLRGVGWARSDPVYPLPRPGANGVRFW